MDALPPSLPNAGPPQPAPAGMAGLAILLADLSQALAKLPAGTQIPALVTQILPQPPAPGQPPQPQPQQFAPPPDPTLPQPAKTAAPSILLLLSTPDGPAQVRIPATVPIPVGAKLEIAVAAAGPQPQWRLTAIDGKPVSSAPAPLTVAAPAPSGPVAAPAPRPTAAPGIPATLIKSTDPALPSGTTLLVRITNLVPPPAPQPGATAVPPPAAAATPEATTAAATAPPSPQRSQAPEPEEVPTPLPDPEATAPVPTPMTMTVTATQIPVPSPTPTAAPASAPPPVEISGEVLPNKDAGRPLLRTPAGLLALTVDPQSAPPTGARLTLALIGKPVPPAALPLLAPPLDDSPDKALPRRLTQLVEQMQSSGNEKLAEAVRQAIPAPGPKLAAQLLSVIASAEPSQGLPRLLGDGLLSALAHTAPEAVAALSRQWEAISQPVQGPDNGDWRTLLVPLMMGGQFSLVRLTLRQKRRGTTPADREKGTRFLLDLDLSKLGPMQFDGLVKRQHKRFDLIIRTRRALSGEMRRDIDGLFLNGLVNFGLQGSVAFQPEGRFLATRPLTGDANGIIFA